MSEKRQGRSRIKVLYSENSLYRGRYGSGRVKLGKKVADDRMTSRAEIKAESGYRRIKRRSGSVRAERYCGRKRDIREAFLEYGRAKGNRPDISPRAGRNAVSLSGRDLNYRRLDRLKNDSIQKLTGRIADVRSKFRIFLYRGTGLYHLEHRRKTCCFAPERWQTDMRVSACCTG